MMEQRMIIQARKAETAHDQVLQRLMAESKSGSERAHRILAGVLYCHVYTLGEIRAEEEERLRKGKRRAV